MDTGTIIAGFFVGIVGFSFFLYGKKQARLPQLIVGILLMAIPLWLRDPLWLCGVAVLLIVGLKLALHYEAHRPA